VWTKSLPERSLILSMRLVEIDFRAVGGRYLMQYTLRETPTSTQYIVKRATWADWDQRGRLVFARDGKLCAAEVDDPSRLAVAELADFNAARPEPRVAPPEATR
jgi:hypothetical protein